MVFIWFQMELKCCYFYYCHFSKPSTPFRVSIQLQILLADLFQRYILEHRSSIPLDTSRTLNQWPQCRYLYLQLTLHSQQKRGHPSHLGYVHMWVRGFLCSGQARGRRVISEFSNIQNYQIQFIMLRKKNYKEEEHFSQFYSFSITSHNGRKVTVYYKRYRPAEKVQKSVYDAVNNRNQKVEEKSQFPVDRTLEALSFDGDLQFARNLFRKVGKVRKFVSGESRYKGKEVNYCIVIFKYQYDLVKCFADQYLQNVVNKNVKGTRPNEEQAEDQRRELIVEHLGDELEEANKLQQLYDDGFNPVTNKFGEFKVNRQANQKLVEDLPQVKRQKKIEQKRLRQQDEGLKKIEE